MTLPGIISYHTLEISIDGDFTTSLRRLFQSLIVFTVKKFFLILGWNDALWYCPSRSQFHFSSHFSSALLLLLLSSTACDTWQAFGLLREADTCYSCSKQLASVCHHRTRDENNFPVFNISARFLQSLYYSHIVFSLFAISFSDINAFVNRRTQTVINWSPFAQGKALTLHLQAPHLSSFLNLFPMWCFTTCIMMLMLCTRREWKSSPRKDSTWGTRCLFLSVLCLGPFTVSHPLWTDDNSCLLLFLCQAEDLWLIRHPSAAPALTRAQTHLGNRCELSPSQ